ncbi:MAG TPA: hypothetical protein VLR49_08040 [Ferruginibacter sp.]|nr:hypothetical protein [Ferruginibacter sp.]
MENLYIGLAETVKPSLDWMLAGQTKLLSGKDKVYYFGQKVCIITFV